MSQSKMAFLAILSPYSLFHLRWGSEAAYAGSASFSISMMIIRSKRLAISELEIRMSREWMPGMDRLHNNIMLHHSPSLLSDRNRVHPGPLPQRRNTPSKNALIFSCFSSSIPSNRTPDSGHESLRTISTGIPASSSS